MTYFALKPLWEGGTLSPFIAGEVRGVEKNQQSPV